MKIQIQCYCTFILALKQLIENYLNFKRKPPVNFFAEFAQVELFKL